jgi:putative sterol carrier protein
MALMPNPILLYAVGGALILGAASGYKVRDWQCDAAYAKALEKAEKSRVKKQGIVDDISQTYEYERDQANVVATERTNTIREIYKTAPAVPVDCAGSDALRRVLEGSVRDANAAATGKPSVEVPNTSEPASGNDRP